MQHVQQSMAMLTVTQTALGFICLNTSGAESVRLASVESEKFEHECKERQLLHITATRIYPSSLLMVPTRTI